MVNNSFSLVIRPVRSEPAISMEIKVHFRIMQRRDLVKADMHGC